jgi:hypothetical protein
MKKILLIFILALSSRLTWADGGSSGTTGGGDRKINFLDNYDEETLARAVAIIRQRVEKETKLPVNLKKAFIKELDSLLKDKKFYYSPFVVALGIGAQTSDAHIKAHPTKDGKLAVVTVGAYTGYRIGDPVVLTAQSNDYSDEKKASLISHEIWHHALVGYKIVRDIWGRDGEPRLFNKMNEDLIDEIVGVLEGKELNPETGEFLLGWFPDPATSRTLANGDVELLELTCKPTSEAIASHPNYKDLEIKSYRLNINSSYPYSRFYVYHRGQEIQLDGETQIAESCDMRIAQKHPAQIAERYYDFEFGMSISWAQGAWVRASEVAPKSKPKPNSKKPLKFTTVNGTVLPVVCVRTDAFQTGSCM